MKITNHERICRMFIVLRDELIPYVVSALEKIDGESWERRLRETLRKDDTYYGSGTGSSNLDIAALLLIVTFRWQDCFASTYRLSHGPRGYVSELRELRNKWAHQVEFENESAARAIETANLLLQAFSGARNQELINLRNEINSPVLAGLALPNGRKGKIGNNSAPTRSSGSLEPYVRRISYALSEPLVRVRGSKYSNSDDRCRVVCSVSKTHEHTGETRYWFSIQPPQVDFLAGTERAFIAFCSRNTDTIVLMPFHQFSSLLDYFNRTVQEGWHVHMVEATSGPELVLKGGGRINVKELVLLGPPA